MGSVFVQDEEIVIIKRIIRWIIECEIWFIVHRVPIVE